MGCNCGSGRRGGTSAATIASGGSALVYRLFHPNGATVDYWTEGRAQAAMASVPDSYYEQVDYRTGMKVGP